MYLKYFFIFSVYIFSAFIFSEPNGDESRHLDTVNTSFYQEPVVVGKVKRSGVFSLLLGLFGHGESHEDNKKTGLSILGDREVVEFIGSENPNPKIAIVYFPGCLGNAIDAQTNKFLEDVAEKTGCPIFQLTYPWHFNLDFKHTEADIKKAEYVINKSEAMVAELKAKGFETIIPMGFSFGTPLAIRIADQEQSPLMCLSGTYSSIERVFERKVGAAIKKIIPLISSYKKASEIPYDELNNVNLLQKMKHSVKVFMEYDRSDCIVGGDIIDRLDLDERTQLQLYEKKKHGIHTNMERGEGPLPEFIDAINELKAF